MNHHRLYDGCQQACVSQEKFKDQFQDMLPIEITLRDDEVASCS